MSVISPETVVIDAQTAVDSPAATRTAMPIADSLLENGWLADITSSIVKVIVGVGACRNETRAVALPSSLLGD
jgi:hypothetical protein